jgi:hypothetical protein
VTRLEQRYRLVLRLLPAAYRAAWEHEMVATFLESRASDDPETAEFVAGFGRPSWPEVASVAALAGMLTNAAVAGISLGTALWHTGRFAWLPPPPRATPPPAR